LSTVLRKTSAQFAVKFIRNLSSQLDIQIESDTGSSSITVQMKTEEAILGKSGYLSV